MLIWNQTCRLHYLDSSSFILCNLWRSATPLVRPWLRLFANDTELSVCKQIWSNWYKPRFNLPHHLDFNCILCLALTRLPNILLWLLWLQQAQHWRTIWCRNERIHHEKKRKHLYCPLPNQQGVKPEASNLLWEWAWSRRLPQAAISNSQATTSAILAHSQAIDEG